MALQSRNNDKPIETSEMVSAFDKFVNDVVGFVENLFKKPEVSLDEFASKSSKEIDKISKTALVKAYYNLLDTDTKQRYEYEEKIHYIKGKINVQS